mmetsp:Transcript_20649/g.53831  ORF Transcript_20649/g.53831 Transcript_20649/m.53831 type:complete len:80 (-) Transcript_20649:249-488(-)
MISFGIMLTSGGGACFQAKESGRRPLAWDGTWIKHTGRAWSTPHLPRKPTIAVLQLSIPSLASCCLHSKLGIAICNPAH